MHSPDAHSNWDKLQEPFRSFAIESEDDVVGAGELESEQFISSLPSTHDLMPVQR